MRFFQSIWFTGNFLDNSAVLMCAALGAFITFKTRLFNLGGEGQIYFGGLISSALLLAASPYVQNTFSGALILTAAFFASLAAGAILGIASGFLKKCLNASELLSTFLLSAALSPVCDALISGVYRDKSGNLLASAAFGPFLILPKILPPSNLSISFIIAPLIICVFFFYLTRTAAGFRFNAAGTDSLFARFGGIKYESYTVPVMALSAALHGLAGFFICAGSAGRLHQGFAGGAGWNAIAVALLAGKRPLLIIPISLVFCAFLAFLSNALLIHGFSSQIKNIVEALFLVTAASIRFLKVFNKKKDAA